MKIRYSIYMKSTSEMYEEIKSLLQTSNLIYTTSYNITCEEVKIIIISEGIDIYSHIMLKLYVKDFPNNNIKLENEILTIGDL
jgi:hypothetical protein